MTETVEELQAQLVVLNKARASGARSISYSANGVQRSIEYRSVLVATNKGLPARLAFRNRFPGAPPDFDRDD
jgi:hypothetical protein